MVAVSQAGQGAGTPMAEKVEQSVTVMMSFNAAVTGEPAPTLMEHKMGSTGKNTTKEGGPGEQGQGDQQINRQLKD